MNKVCTLLLVFVILVTVKTVAQDSASTFNGAVAEKNEYRAVYQLNSDDSTKIKSTIRNIQNALNDPRLKGKIKIELVFHGGGITAIMKNSPYEEPFKQLQHNGVILAECLNTMREKNITKDQLFPFISFVPSGNGELIIREQQGWAYVHP